MSFGTLKGTLVGGASSVTNPLDATGSVSVVIGDLIVAVYSELTADSVTAITDNLGNSYTAQNVGSLLTVGGRAFWSKATVGGTLTAVHAATTASAHAASIIAGVFDQGPQGFVTPPDTNPANTTGDVTSPFTCPLTGTLAQADEFVIGWMSLTRGQTNTAATAPFTLAVNNPSGTANLASSVCAALAYQVVNATTSTQANFTCASGTFNGSVLGTMSFKQGPIVTIPYRQQTEFPNPRGWDDLRNGVITNKSFLGNGLAGLPSANATHILRAPLYTRLEPINPGAAIRATLENRSEPLALAGKDARLIGQAAISPNPIGATPSIDLRTHIQPLNLLAGQDRMVPGKAAADPNPRAHRQPVLADPPNLLATTLQTTAPFTPLDWPNPRAPATSIQGDPPNLLPTTLLGPNAYILRAPQVTRYERASYDAALREPGSASLALLAPVQPPFVQTDWPNPAQQPARPSFEAKTALSLTDIKPLAQSEWTNPRAAVPTAPGDPLNLLETTLQPAAPAPPFAPLDWPVPKGAVPLTHGVAPLDLLNTTLAGQGPAPFAQTDWPVPRTAIPVVTLRENIPQQTIYVPPPTFVFRGASQLKYESPRGWRTALDALSLGTNLELLGGPPPPPPTLPPNCYDWPNPTGPAYPTSLRIFSDPFKLNLLGQDSMFGDPGQVPGYSSAQPRDAGDYQLEISTGSPLPILAGILPAPFNQTDWPNPRGYDPRQAFAHNPSFILVAPALKPFGQSEWPNPLPPRVGNQYLAQNTSFSLTTAGVPPFSQNAWPNPLPLQRSNPDHVTQDLSAILPPPVVVADMPWSGFTSNMGRMMTRRG